MPASVFIVHVYLLNHNLFCCPSLLAVLWFIMHGITCVPNILTFSNLLLLQDIPPVKNSIVNSSGCAPPILNLSDPGKFLSSPSLPYPLHLTPAEHHHQKGNPLSRRCVVCVCLYATANEMFIYNVHMDVKILYTV